MTQQAPPSDDLAQAAREAGFGQGVQAMRRTLATTPVGWALVLWMCWGRVPQAPLLAWLAAFALTWALNLWILRRVARDGARSARHGASILGVAIVDGMAWGLMFPLLTGSDPALDAWLGAVLAGVGAINAPVYITTPRCYRAQIGSIWAVAMLAAVLHWRQLNVMQTLVGLTVFYALIAYYMQSVAERVLEGIRLQLANAALARQLQMALQLVEQDAATDALTGQPNRRALDLLMRQQVERAASDGRPFSVLMLDIDHFKQINDVHGHGVGDEALKAFAARVARPAARRRCVRTLRRRGVRRRVAGYRTGRCVRSRRTPAACGRRRRPADDAAAARDGVHRCGRVRAGRDAAAVAEHGRRGRVCGQEGWP